MRSTIDPLSHRPARRHVLVGALAALACPWPGPTLAAGRGEFRGRIVTEWLPDHRKMRLVEGFEYAGPDGRRWPVPKGAVVDGASIPQIFWSVIGGPFEGAYRGPSVVHDFFCEARTRKHEDVHKAFHDAMLTAGVATSRARVMYLVVATFGPRWSDPKINPRCEIVTEDYNFDLCAQNTVKPDVEMPDVDRKQLLDFIGQIEGQADPADVAKIRQLVDAKP